MEVDLEEINLQTPSNVDNRMLKQEENRNCTKTTTVAKTEFTINDNDDSALLAGLPKAEMKIRKLDEKSKLLMDNNENSLSVDTLIEILSANESSVKLPVTSSNNDDCVAQPPSASSTLSSPASSSSSSKAGLNETLTSPGPSPKSTGFPSPKKFPSPFHLNGGKPMISDMNKKMKQVSKRQPKAVYRSQISDNSIGIKLCIKKSVDSLKSLTSPNNNKTPKKRSRRAKVKGQESDSDDAYVKRRKKSSVNNNNNKAPFDEPVEQSRWGKEMPKEILFDVSC